MCDYIQRDNGYVYVTGYLPRASEFMLETSHLSKKGHLLYKRDTIISLSTPKVIFDGGITDSGDVWIFMYAFIKDSIGKIDTVHMRLYIYDIYLNLRSLYDFSDIEDIGTGVKSFNLAWNANYDRYYLMSYSNAIGGPHNKLVIRKFDLRHTLRERIDLFDLPYDFFTVNFIELPGDSILLYFSNAQRKGKEVNFYLSDPSGGVEHVYTLRSDTNFVAYPKKAAITRSGNLLMYFEYRKSEEITPFTPRHHGWFLFDFNVLLTSINQARINPSWTVGPNPTVGKVYLRGEGPLTELRVFSSFGKEMKVQFSNGEIDMTDFEPGTYIVQIYNKGRLVAARKIVKL